MIALKDNFLTRIFKAGANSSLRTSYASMLNNMPIANFDKLCKAITHGYDQSDIVYSIVSKKARAGARAPFAVYRIKSVSKAQKYKHYLSQKDLRYDKAMTLKEDAFEPITHPLTEKYEQPNIDTSATEYTELNLIYLNLTGNTFEYAMKQEGRKNIIGLYVMPSDQVEIKSNGQFPVGISGFQLNWGSIQSFGRDEIIHTKYPNPNWSYDGSHLYGMSPIRAGWNLIDADNEGWDAVRDQRKNRGPRKIVAIDSDKVTNYAEGVSAMEKLSDVFNDRMHRQYKDKLAPIWGKIQIGDVGLSEKDMQILQTHQMTFDRLCNLWHLPVEWFNTNKQSKYNNLEQYNKQAIINGVLPDLNKLQDSRTMWAVQNGHIKYGSEAVLYDPSVFTELDVDRKDQVQWLKDSPYTLNEQRQFLGDEPISNPNMDTVYIGRNKISIDLINEQTNKETDAGGSGAGQGEEGKGAQG